MSEWIPAAKKQDILEGEGVVSYCKDRKLALFCVEGNVYAIDNFCPHRGGPLGEGELRGYVVSCPWHAWEFDVTTGRNPDNERLQVKTYPVKVENEQVFVEL